MSQVVPLNARSVPGFPHYFVTSDGDVLSTKRRSTIALKPKTSSGYCIVSLCRNGKMYDRHIHRLVLEVFVGPCPEGQEARHLDTNNFNNRLSNLAWGTCRQNWEDGLAYGKCVLGTKQHAAKLTDADVRQIRSLLAAGKTTTEIASQYGVARSQVSLIKSGRAWKHVA